MTDSTPLTVLLNRHLTDLQLSNSPDQYLIGRVLARLMVLEQTVGLYEYRLLEQDRADGI